MNISSAATTRFLACVTQTRLNDSDLGMLNRFLAQPVPWDIVFQFAKAEGVAGFLDRHKDRFSGNAPPTAVEYQIREHYRKNSMKTLSALIELKRLAFAFHKRGIPVVVLQGLSLYSVYADPGLRPFVDVDLLVREEDRKRLVEVLNASGYDFASSLYENLFRRHDRFIDLHTHLLDLSRIAARRHIFPADLSSLWDRAVPMFPDVPGLFRLEPSDNFVALSAHVLKHYYSRLIWLVDLREILATQSDLSGFWEQLVERARYWHQDRVVLYALEMLQRMFHTAVPEAVKKALGYGRISALEKFILRQQARGLRSPATGAMLWVFHMKGFRRRLRFLLETLFPRDDVMLQIYPDSSSWSRSRTVARRFRDAVRMLLFTVQQEWEEGKRVRRDHMD